jgi:hypothetical protein
LFQIEDHFDFLTSYHYPTQDPNVLEYAWQEFLKKREGGEPVYRYIEIKESFFKFI